MAAEGPGPTAPSRPLLVPQPASPAQLAAGIGGAALVVIGLLGFAFNGSFATGGRPAWDDFLGFRVHGRCTGLPGRASCAAASTGAGASRTSSRARRTCVAPAR